LTGLQAPAELGAMELEAHGPRPTKPKMVEHCLIPMEAPLSRAYFKLDEALERAQVPLMSHWLCVDVGASPGGHLSSSSSSS
jgi:hypothetical protein